MHEYFINWRAFLLACIVSEKERQFQSKHIFSGNPVVITLDCNPFFAQTEVITENIAIGLIDTNGLI